MTKLLHEILHEMNVAAKQAPRLYFAPFVGAFNGVRKEIRALSHDKQHMQESSKQKLA